MKKRASTQFSYFGGGLAQFLGWFDILSSWTLKTLNTNKFIPVNTKKLVLSIKYSPIISVIVNRKAVTILQIKWHYKKWAKMCYRYKKVMPEDIQRTPLFEVFWPFYY